MTKNEKGANARNDGRHRGRWRFVVTGLPMLLAIGCPSGNDADGEGWSKIQERYNTVAASEGATPVEKAVKTAGNPEFGIRDKCVTCHLGMGEATPLSNDPLFSAHPPVVHDPAQYGCTLCHGGDGSASSLKEAHGEAPSTAAGGLLDRDYFDASCGTCHSHVPTPPESVMATGQRLFAERACDKCHRVGDGGGDLGPDLSQVGLSAYAPDWHERHSAHSMEADDGPWVDDFQALADEEIADMDVYLRALVGMPRLVAGKRLAASLGCRGCHRINGVGGETAPDLTKVRRRSLEDLDFSKLEGEKTLSTWLKAHFLDPGTVVPGSEMPNLGLDEAQAELLTLYVLSLSPRPIPEPLIPRDRILGLHLGERDFATDGASLFQAFCVGCHGPGGEGRRFGVQIGTYPALANEDFLAIADNQFLRETIAKGRPGRRMPAWLSEHTGLKPNEIEAIVSHVRTFQRPAPSFDEVMAEAEDLTLGAQIFDQKCAPCHGDSGAGTVLAPPLSAEDNPVTQNDNAIYGTLAIGIGGTAMGSFRSLNARELRAVIGAVKNLPRTADSRTAWKAGEGSADAGKGLYEKYCVACHGPTGQGALGPQLANASLTDVASDGYLVATMIRGRQGATMPGFGHSEDEKMPVLNPEEVANLVAFLRTLAAKAAEDEK